MQIMDSGTVTSDASATRQSITSSAAKLMTGSTICPLPSGTICASGGSISSILSTMTPLISPMEWDITSPRGACRNRSATRSRKPSRMVYAAWCDSPVERPKNSTFTTYAASARAHHVRIVVALASPRMKVSSTRYRQ